MVFKIKKEGKYKEKKENKWSIKSIYKKSTQKRLTQLHSGVIILREKCIKQSTT